MKKQPWKITPAHLAGFFLLPASLAVYFVHPLFAIALLMSYIVLCVAACFFPQTGFLGQVISRGRTDINAVSLTFDDGPSVPTTRQILDLLDRFGVKATFFVSGLNALRHPELISEMLRRGHHIGNHSYSHNPFLMLKSARTLRREISKAQTVLRGQGVETKAFRPPVGIVNPKLHGVLNDLDMYCVTFNRRARDAGNRRVRNLAEKILKSVKAGDIILLHDVPERRTAERGMIVREVEKLITRLQAADLKIVLLADLIERPVIKVHEPLPRIFPEKLSDCAEQKNFD